MKKLFLLLTVVMAFAFCAKAQISTVATLSHEGQVSVFYSADALKEAYNAAVNGDVITLSSGNFNSPDDIKKNITIRGAGMMFDDNMSVVSGNLNLKTNEANDSIHQFTAEGIYFTGTVSINNTTNPILAKCKFKCLRGVTSYYSSERIKHVNIFHSIIDDCSIYDGDYIISNSYLKTNCMSGNMNVQNCVIERPSNDDSLSFYGLMSNSVLIYNLYINTDFAVVRNCICVGSGSDFFTSDGQCIAYDNKILSEDTEIFKEGTTTYELTDANKAAWIGSDGTEIGMHGGLFPFTTQLSNPQITKFEVAPKTDSEGKLSVNIEVKVN